MRGMGGRQRAVWDTLAYALFTTLLSACNMPSFTPHITPVVWPSPFSQPQFSTLAAPTPNWTSVAVTAGPTLAIGTVEFTPSLSILCTTDVLRLREAPGTGSGEITIMTAGTEVERISDEAPAADGYTWYHLQASGRIGWAASEWLAEGECPEFVPTTGGFGIVVSPNTGLGTPWMGETMNCNQEPCTHYGVDVISGAYDSNLYSPWSGQVSMYDGCSACPGDDGNTYDEEQPTYKDYNYGYGATIIIEYAYGDLSEDERTGLSTSGVDLLPGQSLYIMYTHLDRALTDAATGESLAPGDAVAVMDNSGNSEGTHVHVEAAVNESGLSSTSGQSIIGFWGGTVAERKILGETEGERRGNRVDPTPLFSGS